MSKKMTPCEQLGYKVGDEFTVIRDYLLKKGTIVVLAEDDGSEVPWFACGNVRRALIIGSNPDVEPVAKLKPAKQALADAIHQNGGWLIAGDYNFVTSNHLGFVKFFHQKPRRDGVNWVEGSCSLAWVDLHRQLPNWHQCILSRDEYFTAHPEQVNVEVKNETKHKVEVEMTSKSEMKIKAGDWHKNGELPPVGEVCEFVRTGDVDWHKQLNTGTEVTILAHYSPCNDGEIVAVFCYKVCDEFEEGRIVDQGVKICFRPLRTERDKEIDEIISTAKRIGWNSEMASQIIGEVAAELYDAGYRKEVK